MHSLPRVTEASRERVSREFDDLGPAACVAEVLKVLEQGNPELLDMAQRCARDIGEKTMAGFAMFYRLLIVAAVAAQGGIKLNPIPRIAPETRDRLTRQIDKDGAEGFTTQAIEHMEQNNPELLQMVHGFASRQPDYGRVMQGFALLYQSLILQLSMDRPRLH
jgi:hypothetical protein